MENKEKKVATEKDTKKPESDELTDVQKKLILEMYKTGNEIATLRQRPLLLMFYSKEAASGIVENDIYMLENKFDEKIPNGVNELDLCLQTMGGESNTSYLLAQLIREYCNYMEVFVPNYAYSGGTLISLSANRINLGKTARISPIDLQLSTIEEDSSFALVNIEKYIEFVMDSCGRLRFDSDKEKTNYTVPLMLKLVDDFGTEKLGELFRLRGLSEYHAKILLNSYMFKNEPDRKFKTEMIIKKLTSDSPAHDFEIDYRIGQGIGLKIEKMDDKIYKLDRLLISICSKLKREGVICKFTSSEMREPFFELFLPNKQTGEKND